MTEDYKKGYDAGYERGLKANAIPLKVAAEPMKELDDKIRKEGYLKGLKEIIEVIKENTEKNRYRDGETAFDIVQDIENKLKDL